MTNPTQRELEALAPLVDRAHVAIAAERRLPPMETAKALVSDALMDDVGAVLRDREERKLSDELEERLMRERRRWAAVVVAMVALRACQVWWGW